MIEDKYFQHKPEHDSNCQSSRNKNRERNRKEWEEK